MRLLPEPLSFEWDGANSGKNLILHGVSNQEAEEAFLSQPNAVFEDEKHSAQEKRHGLFGETAKGRKLTVVFTLRKGRIRVISARDMSKRERRAYEKIKENPEI